MSWGYWGQQLLLTSLPTALSMTAKQLPLLKASTVILFCSVPQELMTPQSLPPVGPDSCPPGMVHLGFQLLLVFLPPVDMVTQLAPPHQPPNSQLESVADCAADWGQASGGTATAGLLGPLRSAARAAVPEATLVVGCVGLNRHLEALERLPGSVSNQCNSGMGLRGCVQTWLSCWKALGNAETSAREVFLTHPWDVGC